MGERTLILDCDPGIDDAIAIGFLSGILRENENRYEKVFMIATWGNTSLERTLKNCILCRVMFGINAVIVEGRDRSVKGYVIHAEKVHGKDGLGGCADKYYEMMGIRGKSKDMTLHELVENLRSATDMEVDVIATGPLSSSYELLKDKVIRGRIRKFVWMGGAFFEDGNINPYAEFNSYCDPEGVEMLFEFAREKKCVYVVPLDATKKTQITRDEFIKRLDATADKTIRDFLADLTANMRILILHDPLAVFAFFYPERTKFFVSHASVDKQAFRGRINSIISPNQFLKVVYDFDREAFFNSLTNSLSRMSYR